MGTAAAVGRHVARRRADPEIAAPPSPTLPPQPPALEAPGPHAVALRRLTDEPQVPHAVAEAYREARRAFNAAREQGDESSFARLTDSAAVLWACATLGRPSAPVEAKSLARDTRKLLRLLAEHQDVVSLARAVDQGGPASGELHDAGRLLERRVELLERRIFSHGRSVFETKPSRVAGRLASGR